MKKPVPATAVLKISEGQRTFSHVSDWELYNHAPVMLLLVDVEKGTILQCNRQVTSTTGFSKEEIIGSKIQEMYDPQCASEAHAAFELFMERGRVDGAELLVRRNDGSMIDVNLSVSAVGDEKGKMLYGISVWQDITDRKRAERALKDRDEQLQAILDNTTAVIYLKDFEGCYLLINRRFEELFDLTREEICGRTDYELFSKEQADTFRANDMQVAREQVPVEFEEVVHHQDGLHTYLSIKFPLQAQDGTAYGVCGISTDITHRKKIEGALQESEERFRQLAENINECVWLTELESGRVLYVSPAFERIWGRTRESLYESPEEWIDAIHPDDQERVRNAFLENQLRGEFSEEYRIIRPDGSMRWISDRGFPILDDEGRVYRIAGVAEDVTERKRLEQQVLEISRQEQQRISRELHDSLGQELTGLSYLAKSLVKKLGTKLPAEGETARSIMEGVQRALSGVRSAVKGLTPVDLDAQGLRVALEQLVADAETMCSIKCSFRCDEKVPVEDNTVATHLFRIAQEAMNNAIKHAEPENIIITLAMRNGCLLLRIHDDGKGIDSASSQGSGMGLQIMRYRSGVIGATLQIQSLPGAGTVVTCSLKRGRNHGSQEDGG